MTEVSLAEVPGALGPAFEAGDPLAAGRTRERRHLGVMGEIVGAIAAGEYDELRELLCPDVTLEITVPPSVPWVRHAAGVDEVIAAVRHNFATLRDQRPTPLALAAQGDTVMVMARETGTWTANDEPYEAMLSQQWTFRDEKLALMRSVAAFTRPESRERERPAAA
ncbi:MAG TPA: nuclear transport factor 2 family protein [Longimicrobium sp.]|nr:nuclear transport factor 2 family protein [Longimicrobium sp.]